MKLTMRHPLGVEVNSRCHNLSRHIGYDFVNPTGTFLPSYLLYLLKCVCGDMGRSLSIFRRPVRRRSVHSESEESCSKLGDSVAAGRTTRQPKWEITNSKALFL